MTASNGESGPEAEASELVFVDVTGLKVQGSRDGLADELVKIWDARGYMFHEARAHVQGSTRGQRLGSLWLILNPILNGAMYYVVFGIILQTSRGIENFIGFLLIGVFFFQLTTKCITGSSTSLLKQRGGTAGTRLPPATAPVVVNLRTWLSGFPSYLVLLLIIIILPPQEVFSPLALLVVPIIAAQMALNLGLSLLAAHFVGLVPDLQNLLSIAVRAWMFGSGVMFAAERFADLGPAVATAIHWNPMYWILEHARSVLIYNTLPDPEGWLIILFWAALSLALGTLLVWRRGGRYGERATEGGDDGID
ncbi:ABC transporter permease [Zafaria sp. Z1313]|uniref:ABC transporter permease n=1 Tax=unclassified Zafaria TaxID=2828765 RepID=UPI002E77C83C|nr:ABC transporter permease [Zafaria sp. J156]MEE1620743.1 ABC transporter permease [Zafaria sp. J156]